MKKTMTLIASIALSICMVFLLAACGGSSGEQGSKTQTEQAKAEQAEPDQTETDQTEQETQLEQETQMEKKQAKLLYQGHASIRITTPEEKVIYIDPFAGEGYEPAADLILVTHDHYDHTALDKVENRSEDCRVITWKEALEGGKHQSFDLGYAAVEAVEAGYNKNHDVTRCVGYVITLSDGVKIYVSGDTSKTGQMPRLAEQHIDYAFFCCDGVYNMDPAEAAECAALVQAKHNIPYHVIAADSGSFFDRDAAEAFQADNRLIIEDGEEIGLE